MKMYLVSGEIGGYQLAVVRKSAMIDLFINLCNFFCLSEGKKTEEG